MCLPYAYRFPFLTFVLLGLSNTCLCYDTTGHRTIRGSGGVSSGQVRRRTTLAPPVCMCVFCPLYVCMYACLSASRWTHTCLLLLLFLLLLFSSRHYYSYCLLLDILSLRLACLIFSKVFVSKINNSAQSGDLCSLSVDFLFSNSC